MIRWIQTISGWDGDLPGVLIAVNLSQEDRRTALRSLAAKALGREPAEVAVEHREGRPPLLAGSARFGLHLSTGSRHNVAALAVSATPIGVDVEFLEPGAEIPWNVLQHEEAAFLRSLAGREQALSFARLWSLKEAYLKADGSGLAREPSSFAVRFTGDRLATIEDPLASHAIAEASTAWHTVDRSSVAISAVVLKPPDASGHRGRRQGPPR